MLSVEGFQEIFKLLWVIPEIESAVGVLGGALSGRAFKLHQFRLTPSVSVCSLTVWFPSFMFGIVVLVDCQFPFHWPVFGTSIVVLQTPSMITFPLAFWKGVLTLKVNW